MNIIRTKYMNLQYRKELAIRQSLDYLHIGLDDMGQDAVNVPKLLVNTKETTGLLKLNSHLTGIIVTNGKLVNDNNCHVFLNNDQFCQNSSKTISQLVDVLQRTQEELGHLPRKLLIQHDNCAKDLKNKHLLSFYWILCEKNIFEEILVSMMPVGTLRADCNNFSLISFLFKGHTHNYVDRFFSQVASKLRNLEISCFEKLLGN